MEKHYDIIIVGGGMVGCATAVGLAQEGLEVLLIEPKQPQPYDEKAPPDLRVSAINLASQRLLDSLHAWDILMQMRVHPYRQLSVWEDSGRCDFCADDVNQPLLGYFVENRLLQLALLERANHLDSLDICFNESVTQAAFSTPCNVTLSNGQALTCGWVIAADGANSPMRKQAGIATQGWSYAQDVLAITVKMAAGPHDITWQQFSPNGPMAFLPLHNHHAELIWYHNRERINMLKSLPTAELKNEIIQAFPKELGDFTIIKSASFPIQRLHAKHYFKNNLVLVGDAAHCINPLAGQGVNLGFKDIATLINLVKQQGNPHTHYHLRDLFQKYEKSRRYDNLLMMSAMDGLYAGFSNRISPLHAIRNCGLKMTNHLPIVKRKMLQYAAGIQE